MRYGFKEDRARARRRGRMLLSVLKWATLVAALGAIGFYAYETGKELAHREAIDLRQQVTALTTQIDTIQRDKDQAQTAMAAATAEVEALRKRYDADVPTGRIAQVMQLVRRKIGEGVDVERIAGVVTVIENQRNCETKPVSKRFVVRLGQQATANDSVSFADRLITVTASGTPAVDSAGNPQGWFDPAKPVTVNFARVGGTQTAATGVLPLHHSVVIGDAEHRFVATTEARGLLQVTSDSCSYP